MVREEAPTLLTVGVGSVLASYWVFWVYRFKHGSPLGPRCRSGFDAWSGFLRIVFLAVADCYGVLGVIDGATSRIDFLV